jgi:hypothetical protein
VQVVEQALRAGGFTKIEADAEAAMCKGNYHKGTIWGELRIELNDDSPGHTRLHLQASAAKDNIWTALKGDPNERIIDRFTRCLPPPSPNTPATQVQPASVASGLDVSLACVTKASCRRTSSRQRRRRCWVRSACPESPIDRSLSTREHAPSQARPDPARGRHHRVHGHPRSDRPLARLARANDPRLRVRRQPGSRDADHR